MISLAGNSLLAAQMYGNAGTQVGVRTDAPSRRPDFEQAAKEARNINSRPEKARSFPVDRVELRQTSEAPQPAPLSEETALIAQEAGEVAVDDSSRFAREAPGTEVRYFEMPGSRLDITV